MMTAVHNTSMSNDPMEVSLFTIGDYREPWWIIAEMGNPNNRTDSTDTAVLYTRIKHFHILKLLNSKLFNLRAIFGWYLHNLNMLYLLFFYRKMSTPSLLSHFL